MTNSVFIDSNIWIYVKSSNSVLYNDALNLISSIGISGLTGVVTPYVINEVHYLFMKECGVTEANSVIKNILKMDFIKLVDIDFGESDIQSVLRISKRYNLKTTDAYHAYYCKKLGIKKIATFDKDFVKIKWLKVIPG